ncbi:2-oxo acid dehydrogenase subunit E2 [Natronomonas marina]|uniref:2-oxo acid dehydrogenase subunit E2 n=1 Tax=Natronomonas marina TaxID=2961939 RepID=UPI0020C990DA|nr:2-oxo acid dehydrogenase subunit E2 [Natronomonas marina]
MTDDTTPAKRTEPVARTVREARTLTPMRRSIADRLHESYSEAVHVTVSREVDAGPIVERADAAESQETPVSVIDVILVAVSETLAEHPEFNATFEDDTHTVYEEHNVAVAVDLEEGLVTPVLEDLRGKSLAAVAAERRPLTERVRAGEYSMSDLRGSTFTVSNLGPLGSDSFTPVINPPEVAILGVNRIRERPAVEDGDLAVGRFLTLDLSFDHRVVDGADAARFLGTLAGLLGDGADR